MSEKDVIVYSEKGATLTSDGIRCSCGSTMQFYTVHCHERTGEILAKLYVCPDCKNEAGIKFKGRLLGNQKTG